MTNVFNLPTKEQFDVQNAILAGIASNLGGIQVESWKDVQRITRMGLASKIFTEGDQFIAKFDGEPIIWNIIGIDKDKPSDPRFEHSITIQPQDCLMSCQFSAEQALYYAEEGLPAGEHVFTQDDTGERWKITTTLPVPEGGQLFLPTWNEEPCYPLKARTYAEDRITVIEDNIDVESTEDEETLSETNVRHRIMYGSNNYIESAIRQFLNSDAETFEWEPQTNYDRPSAGVPYTGSGFLKLLDPELAEVLGAVDKQVARNTVTDEGGQDLFSDKVFLLSLVEVGFSSEGTTTGESVYPYYEGIGNTGRIKLLGSSPRSWWLRSPHVSNAYTVRDVYTSGALRHYVARNARGLAPACTIV
jgi:hypothetical protein